MRKDRQLVLIVTAVGCTMVLLALAGELVGHRRSSAAIEPPATISVRASRVALPRRELLGQNVSARYEAPLLEENPDAVQADGFIIDHNDVALFEQIPEEYLVAARNLHMLFSDRSVGQNINEALDCLTATSWASSPASCRRDYYDTNWSWKTYTQADQANGQVPARILFAPDPVKYSRSNWTFEFKTGSWSELTQDFIQVLAPAYVDSKDVLSYQFSYLNVEAGSDIASPTAGFFANNPDKYDIHDLEAYIAQHPDKTFIFWTTSLARSVGTQSATDFNNQMRQYALGHDKILFDMADIIAHTDAGAACYDNRDGIQYCTGNGNCENHPDDGLNLPAICQDYTTETDGGHLGSVSGGKIRMAKAFWVLMARIAGWDGGGTSPSPTATFTLTPVNSATPTGTGTQPTGTSTSTATITRTSTPTVTGTRPTETSTPLVTTTPTPTITRTSTPTVTGTRPTETSTPLVTMTPSPTVTSVNGTIPPPPEKVFVPSIHN